MIIFKENKILLKEYEKRIEEFLKENPDLKECIRIPKTLDDMFCPYNKWIESITDEEKVKYRIIDDEELLFNGIYIVRSWNDHMHIDELTNYEEVDNLYDYGVVDNASQILQNIEIPENAVVFMSPVFKEDEPKEHGWRWHKHGSYYGIQKHECEYIADEQETEMVYTFSVITLKLKEENK